MRIREKGSCLQVSLLTRGDVHACAPCALFSHRRGVAGNPLSRRGALCPGLWAPARLPLACSLVHDALRSFGCRLRWCGGRALCDSLESEPGRGGAEEELFAGQESIERHCNPTKSSLRLHPSVLFEECFSPPAGSVVFRKLSCLPAGARGSSGTGTVPTNCLTGPQTAVSPAPRCADRGPRSWSVGGPPSGLSLLRGFLCGLCCRRAMGAAAPLPAT